MRQLNRNKRAEIQGTISAAGTLTIFATVPLGPSWELRSIDVKGNSALEPTADTYIGTGATGQHISQTYTGNNDTDSIPYVTLRSGESVAVVLANGTPGAIMRATIVYDEVAY
jgi:hypothetical protein